MSKTFARMLCLILALTMLASMGVMTASAAETNVSDIVNLYDADKGAIGTANTANKDGANANNNNYYSSAPIEVKKGDKITFGPILSGQSWILMGYDADGNTDSTSAAYRVTPAGCEQTGVICNNAVILTYTVPAGVSYIVVSNSQMFYDSTLITKNRTFTKEEYFAYMDSQDINVDYLRHVTTSETLINKFPVSDQTFNGNYNASNGQVVETSSSKYRSSAFMPVKHGDVVYFAAAMTSQKYHMVLKDAEGNATGTVQVPYMVLYEDLGDGQAIFAYRMREGTAEASVVASTQVYDAGATLATVNQPFTGEAYKKLIGLIDNLYDVKTSGIGTANSTKDGKVKYNASYQTSAPIAVSAGDNITFGPVLKDQGWVIMGYDADGNTSVSKVAPGSCTTSGVINNNAVILTYTVPSGTAYIRVTNSQMFYDSTVISKNKTFTKDDYFAYMGYRGINVDYLRPTDTAEALVNKFPVSDKTFAGNYDANSTTAAPKETSSHKYRSSEFISVNRGDVIYFAAAQQSQSYHLCLKKADGNGLTNITPAYMVLYEDLGNGYAIYSYRICDSAAAVSVVISTGVYTDGTALVTVNQPFTGATYRKMFNIVKGAPDSTSPLNGLTGLFMGDSISYGSGDTPSYKDVYAGVTGRSWAGRIAAWTGLEATNASVSGAKASYVSGDSDAKWLFNQHTSHTDKDFDIIVMQGGVNDARHERTVGTANPINSSEEVLQANLTTYIGGLQWLFHNIKAKFPNSMLFFIANHRLDGHTTGNAKNMAPYFDAAEALCETYDIHFIDLYNNTELNNRLETSTTKYLPDTLHLNAEGYDILAPYVVKAIEDKVVGISGRHLSVGKDLTVTYYANAHKEIIGEYKLAMKFEMKTSSGKLASEIVAPTTQNVVSGEYTFRFEHVAPQVIGEEIAVSLVLVDGEGNIVKTLDTYTDSVKKYLTSLVEANPTDTKLVTLVSDLLVYGQATKDYLGTTAIKEVIDGTEDWLAPSNTEVAENAMSKTASTGVSKFISAGVRVGNINKMFFIFTADSTKTVTVEVEGKELVVADMGNGQYVVYTDGIAASMHGADVEAQLLENGEVVQTLTISINDYAYAMKDDANAGAVITTLYRYGVSAAAYASAN